VPPGFCKIDDEGIEVEVLEGRSRPLDIVSLEFAAEFLDRAREALARVGALAARRFNLWVGGSEGLHLPSWVARATVQSALADLPDRLAAGDVYARVD